MNDSDTPVPLTEERSPAFAPSASPPGNPRNPPVMRDVARLAGVSHQTVSRVLNGSPRVRDEVRQRVLKVIDEVGYRRHASARALATNKTMNLGVVSIGTSQFGPSTVLISVAEAARDAGYATSLVNLDSPARNTVERAFEHLTTYAVDGIVVIAPVTAAAEAIQDVHSTIPVVRFVPGVNNGTTMVAIDEESGARLATRHLLELGHPTVHHISGPEGWLGTDARIRGWRQELARNRRRTPRPIAGDWSSASGYRAGQKILADDSVTAVFVANDQMALGLLNALAEGGRRVPEDISVIGFDDLPEAAYFVPPLTTVRMDFAAVGRSCVTHLLDLMADGSVHNPDAIEPELVVRKSTAAMTTATP